MTSRLVALVAEVVPEDQIKVSIGVDAQDGSQVRASSVDELVEHATTLDRDRAIEEAEWVFIDLEHSASDAGVVRLRLLASDWGGKKSKMKLSSGRGFSVPTSKGLLAEADRLLERSLKFPLEAGGEPVGGAPVELSTTTTQVAVPKVASVKVADVEPPRSGVAKAGADAWHRHPILVAAVPTMLLVIALLLGISLK